MIEVDEAHELVDGIGTVGEEATTDKLGNTHSLTTATGNPISKPPIPKPKKRKSCAPVETIDNEVTNKEGSSNKRRSISQVWNHFVKDPNSSEDEPYASCVYCNAVYACHSKRNGTSSMKAHLEKYCEKFPKTVTLDPRQSQLSWDGVKGQLKSVTYNYDEARQQLARMIIIDELPFKVVEGEGFQSFIRYLQPRLVIPHRTTVAKDCMKLYLEEKVKLKKLLKGERLCFTTDTWTSIQNLNYMSLTGHWIDKDWNFQKRILNFCLIPNHKGETIGDTIETCLAEWGIEKILSITVDNASSNDAAIRTLKSSIGYQLKNVISNHEFLHMRCCAHIVNLIVQHGLKEMNDSVAKIRRAVKYVKSSPAREQFFQNCVKAVNIECKKGLSLDVETRWNSTYLMLEAAEKFERAFARLERDDGKYVSYFFGGDEDENDEPTENDTVGMLRRRQVASRPPRSTDWENARCFIRFLKMFYNLTLKFSGSLCVTANEFFHEVVHVRKVLTKLIANKNALLGAMAAKMLEKFNKYWGEFDDINGLLYIAVVLDPRYKIKYVRYSLSQIYDRATAECLGDKVNDTLTRLYEQYHNHSCKSSVVADGSVVGSASQVPVDVEDNDNDDDDVEMLDTRARWDKHVQVEQAIDGCSDLEKYLQDPNEVNCENFDILAWWKNHSAKYPTMAEIAKDVLAIPVSTVASESVFSTSGRVLDPYRSCLLPSTVQGLICAQNWLRCKPQSSDLIEMDDIEAMEGISC